MSVCVCVRVRMCSSLYVEEREEERDGAHMVKGEKERERDCVYVCACKLARACMCACVGGVLLVWVCMCGMRAGECRRVSFVGGHACACVRMCACAFVCAFS